MVSSAVIAIAENTNHKLNRILKNTSVSLAVDFLFFYHTATLTCCVELMCRLCPERGGFCETTPALLHSNQLMQKANVG